MSKTYAYSYMQFPVAARIGDQVEIKIGLRTQTAPVESIRYVYVSALGEYQELIIAFDKPNGSRGILRSYANPGDSQFKAFVDDLAAMRPNSDLRGQPRRDALKTMGARDTQLMAMVMVPVIVMVLVTFGLSPMIIHALDDGTQSVSAGELGKVKLTTRNLVLSGELDDQRVLRVTHTENGRTTSSELVFPVFPAGAPDDAFVPIALQTRDLSDAAIDELAEKGSWKCTLRDVLWEGLEADDVEYMHDKLGLNVTKQTQLCELDDGKQMPLGAIIGMVVCMGAFVSGILVLALWLQRRKQR